MNNIIYTVINLVVQSDSWSRCSAMKSVCTKRVNLACGFTSKVHCKASPYYNNYYKANKST